MKHLKKWGEEWKELVSTVMKDHCVSPDYINFLQHQLSMWIITPFFVLVLKISLKLWPHCSKPVPPAAMQQTSLYNLKQAEEHQFQKIYSVLTTCHFPVEGNKTPHQSAHHWSIAFSTRSKAKQSNSVQTHTHIHDYSSKNKLCFIEHILWNYLIQTYQCNVQ